MGKKYMFAENDSGVHEVKADEPHIKRQKRDLEAMGNTVTILDEDERIAMGQLANQIREHFGKK